MTEVTTETISTTNMTGFRHRSRGSSLLKAPATADLMSPACQMVIFFSSMAASLKRPARAEQEMIEDRPQDKGGKERKGADNQHDRRQHPHEKRALRGERGRAHGDALFCGEGAGDGQGGQNGEEAAHEHAKTRGQVIEHRVRVEAGEGGAVVAGGGEKGVEYLREAVGTRVVEAPQGPRA